MLKKRVIVALLSTVLFSIILTSFPLFMDTQIDALYNPFFFVYLVITGVAYLLGGIPTSMLIDKYVEKEIIKFPLYLIAGFIVGVITMMLESTTISIEVLWFGFYGAVGSLIFFIIISLTKLSNRFV